jgi:hypothetical protein
MCKSGEMFNIPINDFLIGENYKDDSNDIFYLYKPFVGQYIY